MELCARRPRAAGRRRGARRARAAATRRGAAPARERHRRRRREPTRWCSTASRAARAQASGGVSSTGSSRRGVPGDLRPPARLRRRAVGRAPALEEHRPPRGVKPENILYTAEGGRAMQAPTLGHAARYAADAPLTALGGRCRDWRARGGSRALADVNGTPYGEASDRVVARLAALRHRGWERRRSRPTRRAEGAARARLGGAHAFYDSRPGRRFDRAAAFSAARCWWSTPRARILGLFGAAGAGRVGAMRKRRAKSGGGAPAPPRRAAQAASRLSEVAASTRRPRSR